MKKCTLNSLIRLGIFGAITLVTNLAYGQGSTAFANPVVTNSLGQPISGATVAVCKSNPGVAPTALCSGATLATTYTDITIGVPCIGTLQALNNQSSPAVGSGCSNPGLADGVGNVIVFSTSSTYWCEYSGRGIIGIIVQVCVVPNSGGSGPGGAVLVVPTLTQDQSIAQPSTGGTSAGTSLNSNVFEQVRYADQFQFSQSPSGAISAGANTITINAIRGISQYSAPPGVLIGGVHYYTDHYLRIAGTGTPEQVLLTGTSCVGASTGTCTVTFTAANSHSAGYTIGTATAGFEEANIDCAGQWQGLNPVSGCTIKASPYNQKGHFIFNATYAMFNLTANGGNIDLDCEQAVLEDNVSSGAMIVYGPMHGTGASAPQHGTIRDCGFGLTTTIGHAANGTQILIRDLGQNLAVRNSNFNGASSGSNYWDTIIQISADQGFILNHNDFAQGAVGKCDSTWCGPAIYGDGTSSAAIGNIQDNNFTNVSGFSTAIEWISGNGLTLSHNVFQNWCKYPWRYQSGLTSMTNLGGNYYEGSSACINPDFGVTGFSQNTGPQVGLSGTINEYTAGVERGAAGLGYHRFSSTGGNVYTYYIVGNDGSGHTTRPLFIGDAASDGVTPVALKWLKFNATTYDILRAGPNANDGTDAAPYGAGNWAVATGQVCAANPCTVTDTFAALGAYTILGGEFQSLSYIPTIPYWPVPLFLQASGGVPSLYRGQSVEGFVSDATPSAYWNYYDAIFTSGPGAGVGLGLTGMRIKFESPTQASATSNVNPGALILNPDSQVNNMANRKGRINMPSLSFHGGTALTNNCMYQAYDSEANKTLATTDGHQPFTVAADTCMGYDTNPTWLAFQGGANGINFYVNHVMDSQTSAVAQLVSTGFTFKSNTNPCWSNASANFTTLDGCVFRVDKNILGVNTGSGTSANGYLSTTGLKQITAGNATTTSIANPPTNAIFTYTLPATTTARNYTISCSILYQSSVNTAGLILGVNSSVNPTSMLHHARVFSTLTGTSTDATVTTTTSGATLTLAGANAAAGATTYEADIYVQIEEPTSGGTLAVNDSASAAATITILRGSSCSGSVN